MNAIENLIKNLYKKSRSKNIRVRKKAQRDLTRLWEAWSSKLPKIDYSNRDD